MEWIRTVCYHLWGLVVGFGAIITVFPVISKLFSGRKNRMGKLYYVVMSMVLLLLFGVWQICENSRQVPNIAGIDYRNAKVEVIAGDLNFVVAGYADCEEGMEDGEVLSQEPKAGTIVKKGSRIMVYVARKEEIQQEEAIEIENAKPAEEILEDVIIANRNLGYMLSLAIPCVKEQEGYRFRLSDLDKVRSLFILGQEMAFQEETYVSENSECIKKYAPQLCMGSGDYTIGDQEYPAGLIESLEGIQWFRNLEALHIMNNPVTDISAVKECPQLKSFTVIGGELKDVTPLEEMMQLEILDFSYNKIEDIQALGSLTGLKKLVLSANMLTDISVVGNIHQLESFNIWNNKVESIEPLRHCTELRILCIPDNRITDLSVLKYLKKINWLSFGGNDIQDVSVLKELPELEVCYGD